MKSDKNLRLRFAPSPTGYLHIGGARTALFNWLFARHYQGTFILRIEDTDQVRSTEEAVKVILEGLQWLGLDWDEGPGKGGDYGPYFQMQRLPLYQEYARKLLEENQAYYCYCTPEELEASRIKQKEEGKNPQYDRHCLYLTEKERKRYEAEGRRPVVRLLVPSKKIVFNDLLRGEVSFEGDLLGDFVILKSDGIPTYNYAVVIDDALMKISHVMRGDDHISNTPKQILIYEALGLPLPEFAHIPMIMGSDHTRLSKRHGATSIMEYKKMGYLPEAVVNYIARLGWSPGDEREIFSQDELIKEFSLENISRHAAVFDLEKLNWLNNEYIKRMPLNILTEKLIPYLQEANYLKKGELSASSLNWLRGIVRLLQGRFRNFAQFVEFTDYFFLDEITIDEQLFNHIINQEGVLETLQTLQSALADIKDWNEENIENTIRKIAADLNIKGSQIIHPTRVALSGKKVGPGLFELITALGREKTNQRLLRIIDRLKEIKNS